ncbi:PilZ domain-containing protein [Rhodothalassium salexigens DSM 2132]|uniref:PilZ domain-containing protein n=1 Tax=Rhodothalassium salexigens DSM 2132 TaxID=1188247 RepID=A0A4R2PRI6_RHOSA|nr:PilZ domain-containing protein [Rhodothalassium salexigens]MBB4210780.1 hypothetical protein [Rhodothalassium salexigens DSM 2132]MBK1639114.1 hypothetical protein [Rhodothalassium salexigens DSM 2132]TCP37664.1 PilZ domain-containing protein [Rhodothalassium salexigens DSM 2132]
MSGEGLGENRGGDANRRREDRLAVGVPCVIGLDGVEAERAFIVDWSDGGLGLRLPAVSALAPGQVVHLTAAGCRSLTMTVAWVCDDRLGLSGDGATAFTHALAQLAGIPLPHQEPDATAGAAGAAGAVAAGRLAPDPGPDPDPNAESNANSGADAAPASVSGSQTGARSEPGPGPGRDETA